MKKLYTLTAAVFTAILMVAQAPYAHYPLNGNADDISVNNLDGTIIGSPASTANRYNQANSALNFNGSSDYIKLPSAFDFPNRTIIVWFNAATLGSANNANLIYSNDGSTTQNGLTAVLGYDDGSQKLVKMTAGNAQFLSSINTNLWYQAAIVRTPSYAKFFVNGVLVYQTVNPDNTHSTNGVWTNGIIGADRGYNAKFNGKIDDLIIYDVALPDSAIQNTYNDLKDKHEVEQLSSVYNNDGTLVLKMQQDIITKVESVEVLDVMGKLIAQRIVTSNDMFINETPLMAGSYLVKINLKDSEKFAVKKVIVN